MSEAIKFGEGSGLKYTVGNAVFKVLMKTPIAAKMDPMWILSVKGRKSGRQIKTPVGFHEIDGQRLMLSAGNWRHNFADGDYPFALERGKERVTGKGTLVTDLDVIVDTYVKILDHYAKDGGIKNAARMTGSELGADRLPTADEIRAAVDGSPRTLVHVALD